MSNRMPQSYRDEDISASLLGISIAFIILETTVMALMYASRYYARGERVNLWMETFMTITYVVCQGKITVAILTVKIGGAGRHLATLPPKTIQNAMKLSAALQIVCPLTTSLAKLGVLCLFHRIFAKSGRWYRIVIRATFALVVAMMIAQFLIPFLNCRPFSKTWNPQEPGSCAISGLSLWRYMGTPNVFTTLIMVAIPVPALARLHVSRPMKFGLAVVFLVCVLGVVAAIMRMHSFIVVDDFNDITYENVKPLCWTVAESGIYITAGVMPTLKPLLKRVFRDTALEKFLTGSSRSSGVRESRRFSRRWHPKQQQEVVTATKKHDSVSEITAIEDAHVRPEKPTVQKEDVRWI